MTATSHLPFATMVDKALANARFRVGILTQLARPDNLSRSMSGWLERRRPLPQGLVQNPHSWLVPLWEEGDVVAYRLHSPMRRGGARELVIRAKQQPELFAELERVLGRGAIVGATHIAPVYRHLARRQLFDHGLLLTPAAVAEGVRLSLELTADDEQERQQRSWVDDGLRVLPTRDAFERECPELAQLWSAQVELGFPLFVTRSGLPFTLEVPAARDLAALGAGACLEAGALPGLTAQLLEIGALRTERESPARAPRSERAARRFERLGSTVVDALFPRSFMNGVTRFYRGLHAAGHMVNAKFTYAHYAEDHGAGRLLQHLAVPIVSEIVGYALEPAFTFAARYDSRSRLRAHRDQTDAEITVVLQVDYQPSPARSTDWPLVVQSAQVADDQIDNRLRVGDAAIFRGRDLLHSRPALARGCSAATLLMGYRQASPSPAAHRPGDDALHGAALLDHEEVAAR